MRKGRPRLKLEVEDSKLMEINKRLAESDLEPWRRDRLVAIRMAAAGDSTYAEIAEVLERAKSAVQRWVQIFRKYDGDLDRLLKMRRRRVSQLRDLDIAWELNHAYRDEGVRSKTKAAKWLLAKHNLKRAPSTMHYWLGSAPFDLEEKG